MHVVLPLSDDSPASHAVQSSMLSAEYVPAAQILWTAPSQLYPAGQLELQVVPAPKEYCPELHASQPSPLLVFVPGAHAVWTSPSQLKSSGQVAVHVEDPAVEYVPLAQALQSPKISPVDVPVPGNDPAAQLVPHESGAAKFV